MATGTPLRSSDSAPVEGGSPTSVTHSGLRRSFLRTGVAILVLVVLFALPSVPGFPPLPAHLASLLLNLGVSGGAGLTLVFFLFAGQQVPRIEFYPWGFKVVGTRAPNELRGHDLKVQWGEVAKFEPGSFQFQIKAPDAKKWTTVRNTDAAESRAIASALNARWRERQGLRTDSQSLTEPLAWENNTQFPKVRELTWGLLVAGLMMTLGGGAYWVYHLDNLLAIMTWTLGIMFLVIAPLSFAFYGDVPRRIALSSEGIQVDYGRTPSNPYSLEAAQWEEVAKVKGIGLHPSTEKGYDPAIVVEFHSGVVLSLTGLPRDLAKRVVAAARPEKVHLLTEDETIAEAEEQLGISSSGKNAEGSAQV